MSNLFAASAIVTLLAGGTAGLAAIHGIDGIIPHEPDGGLQDARLWDGSYHWQPLVRTDGQGNILPAVDPTLAAHAIERGTFREGGEPTVGVTSMGNIFVIAGEDVLRSSDHGITWERVHSFRSVNYPVTVDRFASADPMLWVDQDTDRIFIDHLTIWSSPIGVRTYCSDLEWSDDEGATWTSQTVRNSFCDIPGTPDHQKIMTAHYGPKTLVRPLAPSYPNVLYWCVNKVADLGHSISTWCAVSYDGGQTIAHTTQVRPFGVNEAARWAGQSIGPACLGLNGHPAAYPDGTVVVPLCGRSDGFEPVVGVTEDNGLTWSVRTFGGKIGQVELDPDITVTPDGTAYIAFRGSDQMVHLLRSKDKFVTWEGPFAVSAPDLTSTTFTGITSGDDGRIALAYLGTRTSQTDALRELREGGEPQPTPPDLVKPGTQWHLFVATSDDASAENPTFVTQQVTPEEDPVQVGCIYMGEGANVRSCRNLLDFIDLVRDHDGRFYVAFTDGCTPRTGCTTDTDLARFQSRDNLVSLGIQATGPSLFAAKGFLSPLRLEAPRPYPSP